MEADRIRSLQSIAPYAHLFPKARLKDTMIKRGAQLQDTIRFIPIAVQKTSWQVKDYVNTHLRGLSMYETCRKLWHFVYEHIQYEKDEENHESIRSPSRLIHDLKGDCDCFSTFISCCLTELKIKHALRVAKYDPKPGGRFQHIYPVVPLHDGSYITIDCVLNQFDKEQPFIEKIDKVMDLELLDGVTGVDQDVYDDITGLEGILGVDGLGDLGFIKKAIAKIKDSKVVKAVQKVAPKVAEVAKKTLHVVNKVNPATVLLRNGVLAAMKLDVMNVASNLKWSYLDEKQAEAKGMNINKYKQLKSIREKLENIFHGAGGDKVNLKSAILTGKGNQKKEVVAGIEGFGGIYNLTDMSQYTPLSQLLGLGMFYSENMVNQDDLNGLYEGGFDVTGLSGLDGNDTLIGLGEPATASIAAATGAMATIAALIKNVGNLFEGGKKVMETVKSVIPPQAPAKPAASAPSTPAKMMATVMPSASISQTIIPDKVNQVISKIIPSVQPIVKPDQVTPAEQVITQTPVEYYGDAEPAKAKPVIDKDLVQEVIKNGGMIPVDVTPGTVPASAIVAVPNNENPQKGFWDKNKNWLKPVLIGTSALGAIYVIYRIVSSNQPAGKGRKKQQEVSELQGTGSRIQAIQLQ